MNATIETPRGRTLRTRTQRTFILVWDPPMTWGPKIVKRSDKVQTLLVERRRNAHRSGREILPDLHIYDTRTGQEVQAR